MPKATTPTGARHAPRHNPLEQDILATGPLRPTSSKRKRREERGQADNEFVDAKASSKILRIGRELIEEDRLLESNVSPLDRAFDFESRPDSGQDRDGDLYDDGEVWGDEEDLSDGDELVEPEDLQIFSKFLPETEDPLLSHGWDGTADDLAREPTSSTTNLAELILARIAEHEVIGRGREEPEAVDERDEYLPDKVIDVYTKVGLILSRYKSGSLPKPFKILPTIPNWESILQITKPELWSPNACFAATRIFISSKPAVAQRFMESVILDRVRDDIHETKRLNVHLWNSLKKGLYRPSAWFKGFLFPLVSSGCTLREAHIVGGILTRVSVPVLHSAAALKGLCDIAAEQASQGTEGAASTNFLIKVLLEKKYALPFQVIDALVFHFLRFRSVDPASIKDVREASGPAGDGLAHTLPVIWHKCLLAFAQRYKDEITEEQREQLLDLLLTHGHPAIGPEVRRELLAGRGRGIPSEAPAAVFDGDDTMLVDS